MELELPYIQINIINAHAGKSMSIDKSLYISANFVYKSTAHVQEERMFTLHKNLIN